MKLPPIISRRVGKAAKKAREARRRVAAFMDGSRWSHGDGTARRRYASYDDYLDHQSSKLAGVAEQLVRKQPRDLADFVERFDSCAPLREARTVLCLGARLGTEVKALRQLGYLAIGIDLNPGADNVYVLHGDFHDLVFPTGSFDAVYTNALDHVFDLARILAEVRRVLKPGGLFVVDLAYGSAEGGYAGKFEALWWQDSQAMIDRLAVLGAFELVEARELRKVRQARWRQAVLRKSASEVSSELIVLEQASRLDGGVERERRVAPAFARGRHRRIVGRGRPSPRQGGRLRATAIAASCLLVATVAGIFLLQGVTPKMDQPQQTWVTPPT
jgi:SAM-dependent methyltransferase